MRARRFGLAGFAVAIIGAALLSAPSGAGAAGTLVSHHPRVDAGHGHGGGGGGGGNPGFGWSSSNWSGYAVTGSGFHSITGSWVVPAVARSQKSTYSSSWIGIDGFNDSNLIQTGTEQDYYSGSAHYGAWWEILPAAETVIPSISVSPGDHMSASISQGTGGSWTITLSDTSNGQSFTTQQQYSGQQTSAEWIQEAPTVGGRIAPLANYGQTTFDPGTVNGASPALVTADGGVMVQSGIQVSTPSAPDGDTDGFNCAYGATSPSAPGS